MANWWLVSGDEDEGTLTTLSIRLRRHKSRAGDVEQVPLERRRDAPAPQSKAPSSLATPAFGGQADLRALAKQRPPVAGCCCVFVPAMSSGVVAAAEDDGHDETWQAVVAEFTSRGLQSIP